MKPETRTQGRPGVPGWERLRHGGLLLDATRLAALWRHVPGPLDDRIGGKLRQRAGAISEADADSGAISSFVAFVLEEVCGLDVSTGIWTRGSNVSPSWGRRAITGETVKPRHRTTIHIRQGRGGTRAVVPVDFSDLSSEYIGILYEGLLDYELKTAPRGDPVIFLSVGDQPALPLSRLEAMEDRALRTLFERLKEGSPADDDAPDGADAGECSDESTELSLEVGTEARICSTDRRGTTRKPKTRRCRSESGMLRLSTSLPDRTNGSIAAPGRRPGRDKRHRSPASSGILAAGTHRSADSSARGDLAPRRASSSPVSSSPASGTWCDGAATARVPGASTRARDSRCPPYSVPCARSPSARRPVRMARRTSMRILRAGRRSSPRKSSR